LWLRLVLDPAWRSGRPGCWRAMYSQPWEPVRRYAL